MRYNKIFLTTVAAVLLLAGCSEDVVDERGGKGAVPVLLTATMECDGSELVTRAGTSLLNSFSSGDVIKAYFPSNVRVGSTTSGSSTTYSYNGTSWSPATQPYFNEGASSCTVHAYYPSSHTNTTSSFSVETDQSTDANYKKSDLMYATATINKGATGSLTFAHRMAKILVTANKGTGISKITAVKIVGGNRTINIATPQSCTLGSSLSNANSSTNITLYSNSSNTSNVGCAGLIPPQTINGNFLQIVTDQGTATYSLSSKQFESAKSYQLTITVNQAAIGTTVAITNWTGTNNVTVNPTVEVEMTNPMMNPLWWVAQYNMAQGGTSFVSSHSTTDQYCFNWTDACTGAVANYRLPTRAEQTSIIPCDYASSNGTNIFGLSETLASPKEFSEVACTVGGTSVGARTSVIGKNASDDYYAVRFIGTPYASAWHYKWVTSPCNGLLIESYLVSCTTVAAAKTILEGLASSTIFTGSYNASGANQTPESTTETKSAFCQRFLPACGRRYNSGNGGSGSADSYQGSGGYYWSATAKDDTYGWGWYFYSSVLYEDSFNKKYGYSVRLFRRGDWGYTMVSSATSADVGKVICSNGHIHSTVSEATAADCTASGIIAYVGDAGSADKSTNSGSYKGLALALCDCGGSLAIDGTTCKWYTADNGTCVCQSSSTTTAIGSSGDWGKGIDNTNRLATRTCNSGHNHAAAQYAKTFSVARPTGASQWFLPTMYQWNLMVKAMCGKSTDLTYSRNNDYTADKFNEKITAAGGRGVLSSGTYWSSVEYSTEAAYGISFYGGYATYYLKSSTYRVRAVFAF